MNNYNFEVLRYLRKQKDFTIEQLAKRSKVSFSVISKLERNQTTPNLDVLQRICTALSISVTELISMVEVKSNELRKEKLYSIDGFDFRKICFNNSSLMFVKTNKGKEISRPEIHEDDTEIVYVLKGHIKLSMSIGDFKIKQGRAMQFDSIFPHTYKALENSEMIIAHIRKEKRF